jgi:hypothetical protein
MKSKSPAPPSDGEFVFRRNSELLAKQGRTQMARQDFDWDAYLAQATYRDVVAKSPALSSDRPPTMYSPDQSQLYLSSIDIGVATDNPTALKFMLDKVIDTHRTTTERSNDRRRVNARIDCIELCGLLTQCSDDPEPYLDPDALLNPAANCG